MEKHAFLLQQIHKKIHQADRILLVSDGKADGDSIGSTSAFLTWLLNEKKNVSAFSIEQIPSYLRFLDNLHLFTHDPKIFQEKFDLILTFDASDPIRCGLPSASYDRVIVFDHHATNPNYGHINLILTEACSTCEVVYRFFETNKINCDARMATSLLTGIITDTSSFSNSGTTTIGLEAAADLLTCGARYRDIVDNVVRNKTVHHLKLWGLALSRLHLIPEHNLIATYVSQKDLASIPNGEEAADGISNFLNAYCGDTECVLVLKEQANNTVKGSLRSIKRDISQIAQQFGGGGHKKAAGFVIPGSLDLVDEVPSFYHQLALMKFDC